MENLMKLVRQYFKEAENQNRFNNLVLSNLIICCSDIDKVNEILNAMNQFNNIQYKYLSLKEELINPIDIVSVILKTRESSNYLILSSNTITNLFSKTNKGIDKFNELLNTMNSRLNYIVELMDDLLRCYLVNLPKNIQATCIESLKEEELNKILESLGRTISMNPEDTRAKELVNNILDRKVELMEKSNPKEEKIPVK